MLLVIPQLVWPEILVEVEIIADCCPRSSPRFPDQCLSELIVLGHRFPQLKPMLIASRNSQDFACSALATASARSKYSSALAASGSSESSAIFPAMRLTSASHDARQARVRCGKSRLVALPRPAGRLRFNPAGAPKLSGP